MCFPAKKDRPDSEKRPKKKKDNHHGGDKPPPPGAPGGHDGDEKAPEEDLTVAEAPDQMPECDLEPFSWRRQQFTAEQLM